ncbi:hypothetical protein [Streptomyces corynorhini]|uniref:Uncharacterized protein n=1 Tax=Streptomyces corynorhini TaxID=2282652 RepID=A0A370BBE7_9ACTN|nr:hypothetical protein [Streptomyces corynorhini]RDG37026.1 hypothetical protein DVH02_16690 [Streptomyces corynorhini]
MTSTVISTVISPVTGTVRAAGPSDLALPLALVHDLVQAQAEPSTRAGAEPPAAAPTRRADEVRTASKARGARRRRTAVRG